MTAVRIARVQPQVDQPAGGAPAIGPVLVVLADDAGRRALPLRLGGLEGYALWRAVGQPSGEHRPGPRRRDGLAAPGGRSADEPAGRAASR